MVPGEPGEPMQEKELLVRFLEERSLFADWQGRGSCFEVLGEGTKRSGVWLVFSLDVKEMELLGHLEEFALLTVLVQV